MKLILTSMDPRKFPIVLDQFPIIIGLDPGADLCLHDAAVAQHECMIDASDGELTVWELDAEGGTTINGVRIAMKATLASGDELGIGKSRFLVQLDGAIPATPFYRAAECRPPRRSRRRPEPVGQV